MDRTKFYNIATVNSRQELDFLYSNIDKFEMNYEPGYYRVQQDDLMRPDLISYKVYGTVKYWWVILLANGIYEVFTELKAGQLLKIPNLLDVYNFYKKYRMR